MSKYLVLEQVIARIARKRTEGMMACVTKRRGKYVLDYYDQNGTVGSYSEPRSTVNARVRRANPNVRFWPVLCL